MNSKTLKETGFSEWFPLKMLSHSNLPADTGLVIAIADKDLSEKPESDILYIGRTKKPAKRILGGYLAGYGGKNSQKINQMLLGEGYIERTIISWVKTDKPRIMQQELLTKYKQEHGMLPKWNSKKKINAEPKKAPVLKRKKTKSSKTKTAPSKVVAVPKSKSKNKAAKAEVSAKTETVRKEKTVPESLETQKPSESEMSSST